MTGVVFAESFRADLETQTRRLLAQGRRDSAERLMVEVEAVAALLGRFPRAGPVEAARGRLEIRRLILRKLPFVAWYHFDERRRAVVVLRLFHARQRRARDDD